MAQYPTEFDYDTYPVTTSSSEAVSANPDRQFLLIQNDSDTIIYVKFGDGAVIGEGIRLNSGGSHLQINAPEGFLDVRALFAIHGSTGTKNLLITES